MGRVSLTEAYDDRSVIAKLNEMDKRVTENTTVVTAAEASAKASADAAQQTADRFAGSVGAVVQNANAQINASKAQVDQAKAEVDATVTTVAQAVQTANNASASAQQSAQTVTGYDARLTAAETKNTQQDTAIGALQTADTQNVKLSGTQTISGAKNHTGTVTRLADVLPNRDSYATSDLTIPLIGLTKNESTFNAGQNYSIIEEYDNAVSRAVRMGVRAPNKGWNYVSLIGGNNGIYVTFPTPPANAPSNAGVNKAYVESTDGATNNLVHRSANEKVDGIKTFLQRVDFDSSTVDLNNPPSYANRGMSQVNTGPNLDVVAMREEMLYSSGGNSLQFTVHAHGEDEAHTDHTASLMLTVFRDGTARLRLQRESGTVEIVPRG